MGHELKAPLVALAALLIGYSVPSGATPAYLVDTGPGPNDVAIASVPSAQLSVDQWLGFRFDTGNSVRIGGVEGWMSIIPGGAGAGRLVLYEDDNNRPGTLLFSDAFFGAVTDNDPADPNNEYAHSAWIGSLALDWKIKSGSYWITFESDAKPAGLVAGFFLPSQNPVPFEAYRPCCLGADWVSESLGLGVRVTKRTPEPGTLALLGLGLAGLAVARRRERQ